MCINNEIVNIWLHTGTQWLCENEEEGWKGISLFEKNRCRLSSSGLTVSAQFGESMASAGQT